MPVYSKGFMSVLSQFKTSLLLNWAARKAGYSTERTPVFLPKPQWHIRAGTAKVDTVEKFCEHLAEFPNFLFLPCLSSPFSSLPLLGYKL